VRVAADQLVADLLHDPWPFEALFLGGDLREHGHQEAQVTQFLADLGIVVRLGKVTPSVDENVAPVLFYQTAAVPVVSGYLFTFSLRDEGAVTARIFREGEDKEVFTQRFSRQSGGRPFTVKWSFAKAAMPEGRYRVVLTGYFLDNNKPIQQTVRFYHQPAIPLR